MVGNAFSKADLILFLERTPEPKRPSLETREEAGQQTCNSMHVS